ncbi:MAG: glycoside hydrolase family 99-like domain-containing protein [Planctomycetes bacterium]|nr:glycoside hydrolase family 99-like domain-containing protein [Planctomycetota bacterium]
MKLNSVLLALVASASTFGELSHAIHEKTSGDEKVSGQTLVEWNFNRIGELEGWQPNGQVQDVKVSGGALSCRTAGADPILELRPLLDLKASPWQLIEVRLKADRGGSAEFFWSNTVQTPYGGFSPGKQTPFNIIGDNRWRTYRIFPFWHYEGKIVRLRFDPYDGANFEVDFIRIVDIPMPPLAEKADFDFTKGAHGWRYAGGDKAGEDAPPPLVIDRHAAESFILGPPLQVNAEEQTFVSLCMSADQGTHGTLFFASEQAHGLHAHGFPLNADGKEHVYNLDLLSAPEWRGSIIALGLRPSDAVGAKAALRWLRVSEEPQGAPELKVASFALEDALPRAGVPADLTAIVKNAGGEAARNVRASLTLPPNVRLANSPPASPAIATLDFGEEAVLRWKIMVTEVAKAEAALRLTVDNAEPVIARARLDFTLRLNVPSIGYVPEPRPVRGKYEVGVYYFPGWKGWGEWFPISRFPERKPVLGWYREGDPEVADWHIKWAVEHGITFFAYDWYWSQGARQLEHGLHDGYFKARYRSLLKFCLLWANHNAPGTSSPGDCLAATRHWIENYFRRPEHLTIDGKPVAIIFSTHRLTEDLGGAKVKEAFDAMRAECREAGLKGLYLIACVGSAGQARQAAEEGYDAVTAYNWPGLGASAGERYSPFELLIDGYKRQWEHLIERAPIPLLVPICGGWDSRPWHGDSALVRFDRNPGNFKRHLQSARRLLETAGPKSAIPDMVLAEAWNEWGEGSYLEPHREFGFGYLDAIREVFTGASETHEDLTPADVFLGPYDVERHAAAKTAWEFDRDDEGWSAVMQLVGVRAEGGSLTGRTTGNDPAFFGPPIQARASEFPFLVTRLRLRREDGRPFKGIAQFFWRTSAIAESEATSVRFEVAGDGEWHEYRLPVQKNRRWRGMITRLRLDPGNQLGIEVEVDFIRLAR